MQEKHGNDGLPSTSSPGDTATRHTSARFQPVRLWGHRYTATGPAATASALPASALAQTLNSSTRAAAAASAMRAARARPPAAEAAEATGTLCGPAVHAETEVTRVRVNTDAVCANKNGEEDHEK